MDASSGRSPKYRRTALSWGTLTEISDVFQIPLADQIDGVRLSSIRRLPIDAGFVGPLLPAVSCTLFDAWITKRPQRPKYDRGK